MNLKPRVGNQATSKQLKPDEQQFLERLGIAGEAITLQSGEIAVAKVLERADLLFLVPDGSGRAVITPRGRRLLARLEVWSKAKKPPSSLLE
jgi:hypothetical protein